jgi:hypothetical protein
MSVKIQTPVKTNVRLLRAIRPLKSLAERVKVGTINAVVDCCFGPGHPR